MYPFSFEIIYKEMIRWNQLKQLQPMSICIHFHLKSFIKKWFDEYQLTTVATNVNMYSFSFKIIYKEMIWWISVDNSCNQCQYVFIFHLKSFIKKWFDEYHLTTVATNVNIYSFSFKIIYKEMIWWISVDNSCNQCQYVFIFI